MLLWKSPGTIYFFGKNYGFNPCSLGCCSESSPALSAVVAFVSFNPCSLGCCSERSFRILENWENGLFQSLFSWMLLWKFYCIVIHDNGYYRFQSLFSWMLLWKILAPGVGFIKRPSFNPCSLGCCSERTMGVIVMILILSFNPCSLGCCSESPPPASSRGAQHPVSILVLLDVALKDEMRHFHSRVSS